MADGHGGWPLRATGSLNDVAIVAMRPRHLGGVAAIENLTSTRPWSEELFASELKQATSRCWVAVRSNNEVVGFACLMSTGFETHITNIAAAVDHRREGIATALMVTMMDATVAWGLDAVTLEVKAGNDAAQGLYRRFGFVAEGVRPKYYAETGEDAVIMWCRGIDSDDYADRLAQICSG